MDRREVLVRCRRHDDSSSGRQQTQCWFVWGLMLAAMLPIGCQRAAADRSESADQFLAARQLVVNGQYEQAVDALDRFLKQHANSKYASRTGLFLFKAHAALGQLDQADQWCTWTIQQHPQSLEAHKCRYKQGMILLWRGDAAAAKQHFAMISDHPNGPLAAEAKAMVRYLE